MKYVDSINKIYENADKMSEMYKSLASRLLAYKFIEDEIDFDLKKIANACLHGIYIKVGNQIEFHNNICADLANKRLIYYFESYCAAGTDLGWNYDFIPYDFQDYGKTWALTRGELENEKN